MFVDSSDMYDLLWPCVQVLPAANKQACAGIDVSGQTPNERWVHSTYETKCWGSFRGLHSPSVNTAYTRKLPSRSGDGGDSRPSGRSRLSCQSPFLVCKCQFNGVKAMSRSAQILDPSHHCFTIGCLCQLGNLRQPPDRTALMWSFPRPGLRRLQNMDSKPEVLSHP